MNQRVVYKSLERFLDVEQREEINLSHYDLMDRFTGRQAACLIAGIDPNMHDLAELCGTVEFARMRTIEDAMEQAFGYAQAAVTKDLEAYPPGFGFEYPAEPPWLRRPAGGDSHEFMLPSIDLLDFWRGWPSGRINVDPSAFDRQTFKRKDIVVWLEHKRFYGARYFLLELSTADSGDADVNKSVLDEIESLRAENVRLQANDLGTRERETLLKIIIGMAVEGYRYDPNAKRNIAVSEIVKDLEALGVAVSDDTVRKYLKSASQLLPPKTS